MDGMGESGRDVVVVGASAGGVEALRTLVRDLPPDLPATVLIVLHRPSTETSRLPDILDRAGPLPVRHAASDEKLIRGQILIAPPDQHMVVEPDRVLLTRGPRENGQRPAADGLFRTAAFACGPRVVGVVLSGVLDDGTAGLLAIHDRGGVAVVQDPDDALYPAMPRSAIDNVPVDHVAAIGKMGHTISSACRTSAPDRVPEPSKLLAVETALAKMDDEAMNDPTRPGEPAGFTCPDCSGPLFELHQGDLVRYRCRVGHAWSTHSLVGEQARELESALWMALRSLEERAALSMQLATRARDRGNGLTERQFESRFEETTNAASMVRRMLETLTVDETEI